MPESGGLASRKTYTSKARATSKNISGPTGVPFTITSCHRAEQRRIAVTSTWPLAHWQARPALGRARDQVQRRALRWTGLRTTAPRPA